MFKGTVNGTPVALDLQRIKVLPHLDLEGKVMVSDFDLKELTPFVRKVLDPFAGTAGVDGRVALQMTDSRNLTVSYDGAVKLVDGDIGGENWATGGTVSWDGKVSFDMDSDEMKVITDGELQALNAAFDMPNPLIDIDNSVIVISGKTEVGIAEEVTVDTTASLTLAPTTYLANGFQTGAGESSWAGRVQVNTGTEEKGLGVLADGKLAVAEPVFDMDMENGQMEVGNSSLVWDGRVEYLKGIGDSGQKVHTKGRFEGADAFYRLPEVMDLSQQHLLLTGETVVLIGTPLSVTYGGDFALEGTQVDIGAMSIGDGGLQWNGDVGYQLAETGQTIDLNGQLTSSDISFEMEEPGLQVVQKQLELLPEFTLQLSEKPSFAGNVGLGASDLAVDLQEAPLITLGRISAQGFSGDGTGGLRGEGLRLEKLMVLSSEKVPVQAEIAGISLTGIQSPDLVSGSVEKISVDNPTVQDRDGTRRLAWLESIVAEGVSIEKDLTAAVERVVAEEGKFLSEEGKDGLASMKQLLVEKIGYSTSEGLVCDAVTVDSLYADILLKKKEAGVAEPEQSGKTAEKEKSGESTPVPVKINRIDVVGESGVKFADPNLARTFMTEISLESVKVRGMDLTTPEKPFSYEVKAAVDKYTPVDISGKVAPLGKDFFIEQEVVIRNLSMLHISPYTIEAIGTFFPSGMMNFTSLLAMGDGMIDMQNNLVLDDITLESVQGDLARELDNQLPVPLNLAVTMLKDADGKIDLDVPIKGRVSDMSIGLADLIWTPLGNAITIAVTPYLAYTALGPAGALTYFGTKLGKKLLETHYPTLEFAMGQKTLTDAHKKSLDEAGRKILNELQKGDDEEPFIICAKVSVNELTSTSSDPGKNQEVFRNEQIRREIFSLGEARALAVKNYLTATHDIPAERLEICNPGLYLETEKKPDVKIVK